jgi:hypothetical protein
MRRLLPGSYFFQKSFAALLLLQKNLDTRKTEVGGENGPFCPKNEAKCGGKNLFSVENSETLRDVGGKFTFVDIVAAKKSRAAAPRSAAQGLKMLNDGAGKTAPAPRRNKSRTRPNKSGTCWNFYGTFFAARRRPSCYIFDSICQKRPLFNTSYGRVAAAFGGRGRGAGFFAILAAFAHTF